MFYSRNVINFGENEGRNYKKEQGRSMLLNHQSIKVNKEEKKVHIMVGIHVETVRATQTDSGVCRVTWRVIIYLDIIV